VCLFRWPIFLLFPLISHAFCPDINGEFVCNSQGLEFQEKMQTRVENGIYIYKFHLPSGEVTTLYADGVKRPYQVEFEEVSYKGTVENNCIDGKLITLFFGKSGNESMEVKTTTAKIGDKLKMDFLIFLDSKLIEKVKENCHLI